MARVEVQQFAEGGRTILYFVCPGCKSGHGPTIDRGNRDPNCALWTWNGNADRPTLAPSLVYRVDFSDGRPSKVCHSFIREGRIEFLSDCTHALAGQTVDLLEVED